MMILNFAKAEQDATIYNYVLKTVANIKLNTSSLTFEAFFSQVTCITELHSRCES